jgi:hypothetical protein
MPVKQHVARSLSRISALLFWRPQAPVRPATASSHSPFLGYSCLHPLSRLRPYLVTHRYAEMGFQAACILRRMEHDAVAHVRWGRWKEGTFQSGIRSLTHGFVPSDGATPKAIQDEGGERSDGTQGLLHAGPVNQSHDGGSTP